MAIVYIIITLAFVFSLVIYFLYPRIERDIQATEERLRLLNSGQLQIPDEQLRGALEEGIRNTTNKVNSIPTAPVEIGNPQI